ncbi:MAG: orotidine-5'-phosphate decarboxylase, partial [Leptonema sp. (in: Bacteria)]|nr:orotidine-5'-phosphate decarboxylase [Leptonema sp. (in: bacteria)]
NYEFYSYLNQIIKKRGQLCVGLDPDLALLPNGYSKDLDGLMSHLTDVVLATNKIAAAYKPNIAFFEAWGSSGWNKLENLIRVIRDSSDALIIADAKRGDLKNTARFYSKTYFETFDFDAVTLQPYMGYDSLEPFLNYTNKGSIILCLTSNEGAKQFQYYGMPQNQPLFLEVAKQCAKWNQNNIMLVVGATRDANDMKLIRQVAPDLPFLVPGIGKQGGDLEAVLKICGSRILINSSRGIACASNERGSLIEAAYNEANQLHQSIRSFFLNET